MTFTEAAIEVLRREGKPLHFGKIAEIAVRENLLDHVGKVPEETMAGQLAAHCRLPADRRIMPVQPGTFALVEWDLEEDPAGLDGIVEPPPEQELPYRSRERHPVPSRELARASGRDGRPRRREEEERRGRRFPPPAEVAYEILAGAGHALGVTEIAAQGAERLLMPDAFVRDVGALRSALLEDNHRRESAGRRGLFQIDGDTVTLVAQPEPGEKPAVPAARAPVTAADARRSGLEPALALPHQPIPEPDQDRRGIDDAEALDRESKPDRRIEQERVEDEMADDQRDADQDDRDGPQRERHRRRDDVRGGRARARRARAAPPHG